MLGWFEASGRFLKPKNEPEDLLDDEDETDRTTDAERTSGITFSSCTVDSR